MKLTLEHYGTVCSIETKYDDLIIDDVIEKVKSLLIAVGFHPKTVENAFSDCSIPSEPDIPVENYDDKPLAWDEVDD